jgi:hypothetical protein
MKKTMRMTLGLTMTVLFVMLSGSVGSAGMLSHKWWKVGFDTPVAFSEPTALGLDAVVLLNPPESELGKGRLEITLVGVPKDMLESMGNDEGEVINYVKSTFFGTAEPAESVAEQTFMGQTIKGEYQKTSIPRAGDINLFLVPLTDGDNVVVGLTRYSDASLDEARDVLDMVAKTFREVPAE